MNFRRTIIPSFIEAVTVIVWLITKNPLVLFLGFNIEHNYTQYIFQPQDLQKNFFKWIGASAFETVVWVVWKLLPGLEAYLELYGGLLVEHTVSENILQNRGIFSRLLATSTILMTAIETVNGYFILNTGPMVARLIGSTVLYTVEHTDELDVAAAGK